MDIRVLLRPVKNDTEPWKCQACSVMNNCALAICKVCGAHRKKKTPQEMASAGKGLFWYAGGKVLVHCGV